MAIPLRPLEAADLDQVYLVNRQIEIHDQLPLVTSRAEFEDWLAEPHFDLAADARGAEWEGIVVGFARVWHRASGEREERAYLLGGVHPDFRRRGIGTSLFGWQLGRATEQLRATGNG
ncbi:MAG TPA: GNAT family N-acetyltransferase, partial [Acidimicrobiia bacterium]|nr:GNAT family N-acetyltransferase [Acidimicrobiia bacterium]